METSTVNNNGIRKEVNRTPIVFDKEKGLYKADYQKEGTLTAQLRQEITTKSYYPSKKVASSLQDNIFSTQDFGFSEQEFSSPETRVAWILVPEGVTVEEVEKRIAIVNQKGAVIYRILSNEPILDENQIYAITEGLKTKDDFAKTQALRFPTGHAEEGKLILDTNGNVQYRRTAFSIDPKEDQDLRSVSNVYISRELATERDAQTVGASALAGQTI